MSVELHNVTVKISGGQQTLFENLNLRVEVGERVGIAAQPKTGKSTLLRLIAGTEPIYDGVIERSSSVSWPASFGDYLVPSSTVATNIRFIGRLCGMGGDSFVRDVAETAEANEFLNEELGKCPRVIRPQLIFALAVRTKFDIYLFDDFIMNGEKAFKEKATQIVQSLAPSHGIVFASSAFKEVSSNCDSLYVLDDGHVTRYENPKEAEKHFKSIGQKAAQENAEQPDQGQQPEEDFSSVLGI